MDYMLISFKFNKGKLRLWNEHEVDEWFLYEAFEGGFDGKLFACWVGVFSPQFILLWYASSNLVDIGHYAIKFNKLTGSLNPIVYR